jgi:hypothetical protein
MSLCEILQFGRQKLNLLRQRSIMAYDVGAAR